MAKRIVTIIFAVLTIVTGLVFIHRLALPYNSEGRYFDADAVIVYHAQAVSVYGIITLVLLIVTIVSWYWAMRKA